MGGAASGQVGLGYVRKGAEQATEIKRVLSVPPPSCFKLLSWILSTDRPIGQNKLFLPLNSLGSQCLSQWQRKQTRMWGVHTMNGDTFSSALSESLKPKAM